VTEEAASCTPSTHLMCPPPTSHTVTPQSRPQQSARSPRAYLRRAPLSISLPLPRLVVRCRDSLASSARPRGTTQRATMCVRPSVCGAHSIGDGDGDGPPLPRLVVRCRDSLASSARPRAAPHSAHVCATVCGAHSIDDGDGDGEGDGEGAANVMRACDGEAKGEDDENEVEGEGEREGEGEGEGSG